MHLPLTPSPLTLINDELFTQKHIKVFLKRDDLIHPEISGNKWRKLKYNLLKAKELNLPVVTFGGAYSNHIAATAAAGRLLGIQTIGIIRGDELTVNSNETLKHAAANGMLLIFINREQYRHKIVPELPFKNYWLIPEGGANEEGVLGCMEILQETELSPTHVICACGTGTTLSGIVRSSHPAQEIIGISAVGRGAGIESSIRHWVSRNNWSITYDYIFGGYGKVTPELISFTENFKSRFNIGLDYVYTAKMMWGIYDCIRSGIIGSGSVIMAVHTGGLQGNAGFTST